MKRLFRAMLLGLTGLLLLPQGCVKQKPELRVLNYADYMPKETIAAFEKEFGCRVIVDNFSSGEDLYLKLKGRSGYDLAFASDDIAPLLIESERIERLDPEKLPNLKNVAKRFLAPSWDPQNAHSVPYLWGVTGIAYNKDKIKKAPESWKDLWDPGYTAKLTMLDDRRECFVAAMFANGDDPKAPTPESIERAKKKLMERKPLDYDSSPRQKLVLGDAWVAHSYNGDARQAAEEKSEIAFAVPREGATVWFDSMVIPSGAPNSALAHAFINYILRPGVSADLTNKMGFANPNELAQQHIQKEVRENPLVYPTEETLKRCFYLPALSERLRKAMEDAWAEVRKK